MSVNQHGMAVNPVTVPGQVLAFWFGTPDDPAYEGKREKWFRKDPAFDDEIRAGFLSAYEAAVQGQLDGWKNTAEGCLALILVFDQFPRNMFRDSARAFEADGRARALAHHAVEQGFDRTVPPVHRAFFYLPFEHSEDLDDQHRSVGLFRACEPHDGYDSALDYAVRHLEIIERFGRFPHRNAVLGRISTPDEAAFLEQPNSGF